MVKLMTQIRVFSQREPRPERSDLPQPTRLQTFRISQPNVKFDRPLDGTQFGEGRLIEISDSKAVIELTSHAVDHAEFFLLLTG
jgi:hypothetical protein